MIIGDVNDPDDYQWGRKRKDIRRQDSTTANT